MNLGFMEKQVSTTKLWSLYPKFDPNNIAGCSDHKEKLNGCKGAKPAWRKTEESM